MTLRRPSSIRELYEQLRHTPFPTLGKSLKDFPAFDAVLAGLASRAANGEAVTSVGPHVAAARAYASLKRKASRSRDDEAFIEYFELLERIRSNLKDLSDR